MPLQKYLEKFGGALVIGVILAAFAFAFWYGASGWKLLRDEGKNELRQISVSGEGKISVRPDLATFYATVLTKAEKVKDAQDENTRKSNAVIEYLKKGGLEDKDIKTVGYSIEPQYRYFNRPVCLQNSCPPGEPPEVVSYLVRHTLEIKVRDFGKIDDFLSGVVSKGANEVSTVQFSIENEDALKADARKKAIDEAREKAKILARDLGVRLGKVLNFSEGSMPVPIYARALEAKGGYGGAPEAAPTPQVEPGEQEVRVNVTITYEFR